MVLVCELSHAAESEERAETQFGGRVCVDEGVAYEDTVLIVLEHHLFLEHYTSHPVNRGGHLVAVELADVLMTFGAVVVALVFVESEVELRTVLHHRDVER